MSYTIPDLFGYTPKRNVPIMPDTYKGKVGNGCGFTKTKPRSWTEDELKWIVDMRKNGFSNEEIGMSTGRSAVSIQIKLKRIGKNNDTYNEHHFEEKYSLNREYTKLVNPKTLLDLYCGVKSWWRTNEPCLSVTTNDKDATYNADYHENAEMLIHKLYYSGKKYDVIDLDPYGSAYECFDLAIKMATKGIIVTFGELGHKRWKRLDFVSRYYGINNMEDFTLQNLVSHLEMIANRNKKHLEVVFSKQWDRIGRVWFKIQPLKITTQWDK